MTPEGCAASSENDTKRLIDKRDGKYYWVAKLADGNCWMTQNLDLDLSVVGTLTPTDSDVSSNWNFSSAGGNWYTSADQGSESNTAIQAWDLGEYVKASPTATTSCGDIATDLSACPSQFTQITSSMAPYIEAVNEGELPTDNVAVSGNNYDAHYLVGNYYSWPAATAESGNDVEGSNIANDSICPANWHLTDSGDRYRGLLRQYGLTDSPTSGNNNISTSPLYFVRSGYIAGDGLVDAGNRGSYFTARAYSNIRNAFILSFYDSVVWPAINGIRSSGYSVRCVAPSA